MTEVNIIIIFCSGVTAVFSGHGKHDACIRVTNCGSNNRRTYYKGKILVKTAFGSRGVFLKV